MSASAQTIDEVLEPSEHPKAPGRKLLLMELRALPELAGFAAAVPGLLATTPRGDGQPVLVLPGLVTSDRSTISLRGFLSAKGYPTYGWEQGRNFGPLPGVEEGLKSQLKRLADEHGRVSAYPLLGRGADAHHRRLGCRRARASSSFWYHLAGHHGHTRRLRGGSCIGRGRSSRPFLCRVPGPLG